MKLSLQIRAILTIFLVSISQILFAQCPTITVNPNPVNLLCAGTTLNLNADVISATSFKWQKNGVDVGNTTKTLTILSVVASDAGAYTFVATNDCGNTTSGTAQVTIKDKPSITTITAPTNVCVGATASLVATVVANGDNNLTYAWALNGTAVPNGNGATLLVPNFQSANAGTYSFTVTNSCGSTSSASNNQNVSIQLITTPSITTISNQSVCVNNSLTVATTITNLGSTSPTYQWYFNGTAINGQTGAQLNISNMQTAKAGRYYVTVNNGCSPTISSNEFNVTVSDAPTIQSQPAAQTEVCSANSFTLSVNASNANTYQWLKNDAAIGGATSSTFNIPSVASSDAATYKVVVSNSCGFNVTSNAAVLVVKSLPSNLTATSTTQLCVGAPYTLQVSAAANNGGTLTYQWKKAGVIIPNATNASLALTNVQTGDAAVYTVAVTNSCGTVTSPDYTITVTQAPIITGDPASQSLCAGATATFTAIANGATSVRWQKNGVDVGNITATLSLSNINAASAGSYTFLATNTCGTTTSAAATLAVNNKPVINSLTTTSPVCAGTTATITSGVNPNGDNSLTYSWTLNGSVITGANTGILSIPNFQSANAGTYALVVTNNCGASTGSSTTTLQLQPAPSVGNITGPTLCQGNTLTLSPTYTNVSGPNVTYQWYFEGNLLNNQTAAQLNIVNVQSTNAGRYFVTVNNGCIPESGPAINVTVFNLPTIQTQPAVNTEACIGSTATLTVVDNGGQTYQWFKDNVSIPNATTNTYTRSISSTADAGAYKVVVSNGCNYSVASNNSMITVKSAPTIISSPVNTTVCAGQPVNASVSANTNGGGSLSYQWISDGTAVSGANSSNFLIERASLNDNGKVYTVAVTNSCGRISGGSFTLNVGDKPKDVIISTSISNKDLAGNPAVCTGSPITFLVQSVSNGFSPSYTWLKDDIAGNTSPNNTFNIMASTTTDAGTYKLKVSNTCGITTSNSITIGVHEKPIIAIQPDATITACENTNLIISGLGQNKPGTNSKIEYSWFYNNNPINGIESNLNLSDLRTNRTGSYILKASNECGTTSSNPAVLTVLSKPQYSVITSSNDLAICSASYQTKTISVNIFTINGNVPSITWTTKDGNITGSNIVGNISNVTVASVGKDATYFATLNNACGTENIFNFGVEGIKIINEAATPSVTSFSSPPLTTFCEGDQIKLFVTTKSTAPESYVWKLNNVVVMTTSGSANSKDFSKGQSTMADQGNYTVDITNKCGTLTNAVSIPVTVNPTPIINFEVTSNNIQCLTNNLFDFRNRTVQANGSTIRYVWDFGDGDKNSTDIVSTSHTYRNSGKYTVRLNGTNNYSCTGSTDVAVTTIAVPRVTNQPIGKVVCQSDSYELIAEVETGGATSLSYQWYFNNQPIANNGNSNSPIFKINSMSAANEGTYYLQIRNAQCGLNDESQRVNVLYQEKPNPSFTAGGKSLNSCVNDAEYTFINTSPLATNVSYLWSVSDGTTSRSVNNFTHKFINTGLYEISLTATAQGCEPKTVALTASGDKKIRVNAAPTFKKDLASSMTIKKGDALNLSVEAIHENGIGTNPFPDISYSWYKMPSTTVFSPSPNGRDFNVITKAVISDSGRYYVNASNSCGVVRSNIITVNVFDVPNITKQPVATKACIDKELQLTIEAISNDNSSPLYQWYYQQDAYAAAVIVPNARGPVLNIAKFKASDAGYYFVELTNTTGKTTSDKVIVTANDVPLINSVVTSPSIESGICINTALQLNASVSDIANSNSIISWEQNGVTLPGQSALQINFAGVDKTNQGDLTIKASNSCGTASKTLVIDIIDVPQFTQSPNSITTCLEGSANFIAKVQTTNAGTPFSFQWLKNNAIYTGTGITSDEQLSLSNIQLSDAALYALRATNACGLKQSGIGKLTVITSAPSITQQPAAVNICAGLESIVSVIANPEQNNLTYSWFKNGNLIANEINAQLIFRNIATTDAGTYKAVITNACNLSISSNNFAVVVNDKVRLNETIEDKLLCSGNNLNVDISPFLSGATLSTTYQWRLNEIDLAEVSARTNSLSILNINKSREGKYSIITTNNCGTATIDLFNLGITNLPVIQTHPVEGTICENLDWTNKVVTSNADQIGFTYQWFKDGAALSGANQPTLLIANTVMSNRGVYSVKLSSACGDVMSQSALLQVRPTPQIDIALVGTPPMQCIDNNTFILKPNVLISDNSLVDLTWDFGDGVTSKQSQVSHSYDFANDFNVYLFAKSVYGCKDTATQVLSVNTKPVITGNIVNQILCTGTQLNYNVDVKLRPNEKVGYQWYFNQDPILNAVNKSITLDNVQKVNGGNYKLRITNACGITYSTEAELKIAEKPIVTVPLPINYKVCENSEMVLKSTIYSLLPNSFQWYKNELPFVGRESDTLRIKQFGTNDVATYSVSITNKCGTTFAVPGNLIMKNIAWSTQALISDTICYQTNTKLALKDFANNDDTLIFSWFKNGEQIIGSDTKEFNINKFIINDTGYYTAKLTNSCGILTVPVAKLTLNKVNAAFSLDNLDACKGSLIINGLDTTRSLFAVRDNYWQIKELNKTLGSTPGMRFQFSNSGTYTVRHAVTDIKGCHSDTASKTVINYGKPTASFTINDTCMTTPSIAINNSVFGHASTKLTKYTWNFGDTTIIRNTSAVPSYTYKTPGAKSLQLIVESDSSCVADTLTKKLMVYGNPIASFVTQDSCQGFPVLFINKSFTQFAPDSVVKFSWNFDDGNTSTLSNPQNVYKQYGAYKIKLTATSASCPFLTDDTTINMTIKSPRANEVYPKIQTVKRVMGQLNAVGNGRSYAWLPYTGLTDTKIKNPKFSITEDKLTYTITITDSAGCVNNDKQEVWAFNKPDIYLATGFSPNNDGVNDKYKPEYIEIKILEYFRVQDSNNRQVFITNSMTDKWDGTYNGNPLPPAPYLVTVAGIDIQGNRIVKQGIVIVVK